MTIPLFSTHVRRWLVRAVCAVCITVCAVCLTACGSATTAPTVQAPRTELVSILQDDTQLHADPAAFLARAKALGIQAIRADLFWDSVAPDASVGTAPHFDAADPSAYPPASWSIYDEIVRDAAAAGIRIYFTLTGPPPLWAAGAHMPQTSNCPCDQWLPSAADFGAFVHAVGERYDGHYIPAGSTTPLPRVSMWSIWNEPNYGPNLAPQAIDGSTVEVSPSLYRGLLNAAWSALQATGHTPRTDTILIGETAPRGLTAGNHPGNFSGMVPLRFVRALYCVDGNFQPLQGAAAAQRGCPTSQSGSSHFATDNPALFDASGFAAHLYPDSQAPTVVSAADKEFGQDYADFATVPRLERTLDQVASAYGSSVQLPIYSTEFGYKTSPPFPGGVPLSTAALYLNESEYLSWVNPRIRSFDNYLLEDPPPGRGADFDTGLEFSTGTPKPVVYDAWRMPLYLPRTSASAGTPLTVWGCARPFALLGGTAHVAIQFSAGGPFRTVQRTRSISPAAATSTSRSPSPAAELSGSPGTAPTGGSTVARRQSGSRRTAWGHGPLSR